MIVFKSHDNPFLAISSQSSSTVISKKLPQLFQLPWDPSYITPGRTQQETPFPLLHPNHTSTVAYVFVAVGNVFTEPLPSNERSLWLHYSRFQSAMSQYYLNANIKKKILKTNMPHICNISKFKHLRHFLAKPRRYAECH
jgi:hypothetical protein